MRDVVVIGAGVAGLACARALRNQGASVLVIERARGVGGRAATRRIEGIPVDHGLSFLHGSQPAFLAALDSVDHAIALDWPRRIEGHGLPCQARAFGGEEKRVAFAEGVSSFPKHLAAGLEIALNTAAQGLRSTGESIEVLIGDGSTLRARTAVLALAVEQARALLVSMVDSHPSLLSALELLGMIGSLPCWSVLARYSADQAPPPWDMHYPSHSSSIQLISNDSSKRPAATAPILVIQSLPRWARGRLAEDPETIARALLQETGRIIGSWATRPGWAAAHRWRYARTDRGAELAQPLLLRLGRSRLGVVGEAFDPRGGVEGAWLAGSRLAERIAADAPTADTK